MVLSTRSKIRKHLLRLMPAVLFLLPAGRRTAHPAKRSREMASEPVVTPGPDGIADEKFPCNPERNEASTIRANGKIRIRSVGEPKVQGKFPDQIKPEPVNAYTGPLRGPRAWNPRYANPGHGHGCHYPGEGFDCRRARSQQCGDRPVTGNCFWGIHGIQDVRAYPRAF